MLKRTHRGTRRGQTLVIFAGGLVAFLGMVGLVIDGGNAFAQQRRTQNGADAAAEAGTTELARRALGVPPATTWDQQVADAINASAQYNDLTIVGVPQYTDFDGNPLGPVGSGIPTDASGVAVNGERSFRTYFAGVLGMSSWKASASATARTGFIKTVSANGLLPVTFPVLLTQCQNGGDPLVNPEYGAGGHSWPYGAANRVALPLCANGPGNVGWIDWTPTMGGASEVAASILNPNSTAVTVPKWHYVAQTGAVTSLDPAMDYWEGSDIYLPIFYVEPDIVGTPEDESLIGTCDTEPLGNKTSINDCPAGHTGGNGANQWYYLVTFASFRLQNSFIQGNHHTECNDPSLASTATYNAGGVNAGQQIDNCLIGYFNEEVVVGGEVTLDPPSTSFEMRGVQLIK
jgi:hypothetical protein